MRCHGGGEWARALERNPLIFTVYSCVCVCSGIAIFVGTFKKYIIFIIKLKFGPDYFRGHFVFVKCLVAKCCYIHYVKYSQNENHLYSISYS